MNKKMCALLCIFVVQSLSAEHSWTWLYQKVFDAGQIARQSKNNEIVFEKVDTPAFSQLVFSWNAFRPERGHFSFWVQARSKHDGTWGSWHKMVEWGQGVQRSYASRGNGVNRYVYVRLEAGKDRAADAFRIKMAAHQHADLALVRSCAVSLSDFSKFKPEAVHTFGSLDSTYVAGVPRQSQFSFEHERNSGLCSPTSCSMVASYFSDKKIDPIMFARSSFDHGLNVYGSWSFNTAHAFEQCDGRVHFAAARFNSFKGVHQRLTDGVPVVVSVRGPLPGAPRPYRHGHLLVVTGWDANTKEVICNDPAMATNNTVEKRYPVKDFVRAWERSRRLVYLAEPVKSF